MLIILSFNFLYFASWPYLNPSSSNILYRSFFSDYFSHSLLVIPIKIYFNLLPILQTINIQTLLIPINFHHNIILSKTILIIIVQYIFIYNLKFTYWNRSSSFFFLLIIESCRRVGIFFLYISSYMGHSFEFNSTNLYFYKNYQGITSCIKVIKFSTFIADLQKFVVPIFTISEHRIHLGYIPYNSREEVLWIQIFIFLYNKV